MRLATSWEGTAKIWDATTGAALLTFHGVGSCQFSPDGAKLLTRDIPNSCMRMWSATTGHELFVIEDLQFPFSDCAFSPDGEELVYASGYQAKIIHAEFGIPLRTLTGHSDNFEACAFSPSGRHIVTTSIEGTATIWDASTGDIEEVLYEHNAGVFTCGYSPDGTRLLTASGDPEGKAFIWASPSSDDNSESYTQISCLEGLSTDPGFGSAVESFSFSPDSARVATANVRDGIWIWDADTGETILKFDNHASCVFKCAFLPDGERIVSNCEVGSVLIWEASTGRVLARLGFQDEASDECNEISCTALSPDGTRYVTLTESWTRQEGMEQTRKVREEHDGGGYATSPVGAVRIWDCTDLAGGVRLAKDALVTAIDDLAKACLETVTPEYLLNRARERAHDRAKAACDVLLAAHAAWTNGHLCDNYRLNVNYWREDISWGPGLALRRALVAVESGLLNMDIGHYDAEAMSSISAAMKVVEQEILPFHLIRNENPWLNSQDASDSGGSRAT